jgi:endonuclease-3
MTAQRNDGVTQTLADAVESLAAFHKEPPAPPSTDPFELVLYENVAYLASDDRRDQAFTQLRNTIGTQPEALLAAGRKSLEAVTALGILKGTSAAKLRACAEIAMHEFGGDLGWVLNAPVADARRALQRFPGIGQPGAEKILLFAAGHPFLAPDSNGLRVLVRLGLVEQRASYAQTYAGAQAAAASLDGSAPALQRAHRVLRVHGQTVCKRARPLCPSCPLRNDCQYARQNTTL